MIPTLKLLFAILICLKTVDLKECAQEMALVSLKHLYLVLYDLLPI